MAAQGPPVIAAGLEEAEAALRLDRYGHNDLALASHRGAIAIVLGVLREPMFLLLVAGSAIYLALGDTGEALALLVSVAVVVGMTAYQERKTERALEALRELSSPRALVVRSGRRRRIAGRDLVPGDLVLLAEGDRVPADGMVLECQALSTDESLLTGESLPVAKVAGALQAQEVPPAGGDGLPFVYSGTLVISGHAAVRIVATGAGSHIGRIGATLRTLEVQDMPLQIQTRQAVKGFAFAGVALCILVVALHGWSRGGWLEGLLAGITLAMAVLPEEFPVVLTVFLALGAWRISREKVLTRRMPAIETLGSATILCVDKTGTLTENRMAVAELAADGHRYEAGQLAPATPLRAIVRSAALACERDTADPMDRAIVAFASEQDPESIRIRERWQLAKEYDLAADLLAVTHCWRDPDGGDVVVASKGAPEAIAGLCRVDAQTHASILDQTAAMAARGRRVLGVARAAWKKEDFPDRPSGFDFEFVGLVGLADPVRPAVADALRECGCAGIRVVMITGDYPGTARAVADQIGLRSPGGVLSGADLARMGAVELQARAAEVNIFARVLPEQKLALVNALKANGEIVAMTGDGVNDAPALKAAHIGIAMGGRGTDVAREAASLVLLEDDFGSIVDAVRLGRRIYDNIRHAMAYLIAVHVPTAGMALVPLLMGWPLVFAPVHIVFLEFVIDPACSFAFEAEPAHPAIMKRAPRDPRQALFSPRLLLDALLQGGVVLAGVVLLYFAALESGLEVALARAMVFAALVLGNTALILANRSRSRGPLQTLRMRNAALWLVIGGAFTGLAAALYVPTLQALFGFDPPGWRHLAWSCLPALAVLALTPLGRRTPRPASPAESASI